jgi:serine/threonine protein kinase
MLTGKLPFTGSSGTDSTYRNILTKPAAFPDTISDKSSTIISALLQKTPTQRLQNDKVKQDPYFENIDWDAVLTKQVRPPFVPDISGDDLKYFSHKKGLNQNEGWDDENTGNGASDKGMHFEGFSFHK